MQKGVRSQKFKNLSNFKSKSKLFRKSFRSLARKKLFVNDKPVLGAGITNDRFYSSVSSFITNTPRLTMKKLYKYKSSSC